MSIPSKSGEQRPLHGMFTAVPPRYDFINNVITLGMDTRWRKLAARTCIETNPLRFLDVGCGTGDLSITVARLSPSTNVYGLDFSETMLEKAGMKAAESGLSGKITFIRGDAANMPFEDASFDCVGISFAFRNLTYKNPLREPHLAEVRRVLRPGGRYVIVESSQPDGNWFIRTGHKLYLKLFVGPVGQLLSGNKGAYRYLAASAADYYTPDEVRTMLMEAGFSKILYRPLFFGAVGIHIAYR